MDIKRIYNNITLFPFEKINRNKKDTSIKGNKNPFYMDLLKTSICKNSSEEALQKYCILNNFDEKDLVALTSKDANKDDQLPDWVYTLDNSLKYINLKTISFSEETQETPFHHLLSPFVEFCFYSFTQNLMNKEIKKPSSKVISSLKKTFYTELFMLSIDVFSKEFSKFIIEKQKNHFSQSSEEGHHYKEFINENLQDKLKTIFVKYPVLARLIATKTQRYSLFITNLLERFTNDKSQIETCFKQKLGDIQDIHLNAGDQHNGETTAILEFSDSFKLVYKPTNLYLTTAYNQFLEWINKSLNENLKTFKILDRFNYGWIEFV